MLPVLPTPFTEAGAVDPEAMAGIVDFAVSSGVDGVVFPGFASEVDELSAAERTALLKVVVNRIGGRLPIVAGASAPTALEAISHCREALANGITHVMIQAPKSVGTTTEAVSAFYREIAAAAPGIEIVLQNAPAPRGSDLRPEAILAIVRDNPAIIYVKEETLPSGLAISAIVAGKPAHLKGVIGGGGARYLIDEYNRDACGAMPAVELADIHVAMDRAYRAGDLARARDLYMRTLPLLVIQFNFRMAFTKHVLTRRGVLTNQIVRAKVPQMDARDVAEIDAWLEACADLMTVEARAPALAGEA
ncbi:dihydrodipicolinate synthase family protein [Bosea vestrisii]|uniref:dihydrodipicolinate synthase family protein n=1 Tax=Bosea vestrisii TaxID=151416 RepID=UPI0024DF812D|nr:dihydrodipicolinate synthase family protein [Bosea vestrisii]WID94848.1 dihydrodipicolinate synthase family protein [Bosea vestrisii]